MYSALTCEHRRKAAQNIRRAEAGEVVTRRKRVFTWNGQQVMSRLLNWLSIKNRENLKGELESSLKVNL